MQSGILRTGACSLLLVVLLVVPLYAQENSDPHISQAARPNIVFILSDDK